MNLCFATLVVLVSSFPLVAGCGAAGATDDTAPDQGRPQAADQGPLATDLEPFDGGPADAGAVAGESDEAAVALPWLGGLRVDRYEASRPDASATSGGSGGGPAQSRPGVIPWTGVDQPSAAAACQAAGARLCRQSELLAACQGSAAARSYPYGQSRDPAACNDYHAGLGVIATGTSAACHSPEGIFDLVGNAAEWVEQVGDEEPAAVGGSAKLSALAVSLQLDRCSAAERLPAVMARDDLGFRCCGRPRSGQ